jgi:hypothetical protein
MEGFTGIDGRGLYVWKWLRNAELYKDVVWGYPIKIRWKIHIYVVHRLFPTAELISAGRRVRAWP